MVDFFAQLLVAAATAPPRGAVPAAAVPASAKQPEKSVLASAPAFPASNKSRGQSIDEAPSALDGRMSAAYASSSSESPGAGRSGAVGCCQSLSSMSHLPAAKTSSGEFGPTTSNILGKYKYKYKICL